MRVKDKTGKTFGTLKVLELLPKIESERGNRRWRCLCEACGRIKIMTSANLGAGARKGRLSCGCKRFEWMKQTATKHGATGTVEFKAWNSAKGRCKWNRNWSKRGIKMCSRWRRSFKTFLEDMGPCPKGFTLERKNNNKGYTPTNCKWASRIEQANNRRNVPKISFNGKSQSIAMWSRELKISKFVLHARIGALGWTVEKALSTPYTARKANHASI